MSSYWEPNDPTIALAAALERRGTISVPFVRPSSVSTEVAVIPTNAVANISSAYVQVTAGEATEWLFWGYYTRNARAGDGYDIDWATGAAGSEVVIGTTRDYSNVANEVREKVFRFPLRIAANVRLAARNRAENAGQNNQYIAVYGLPSPA